MGSATLENLLEVIPLTYDYGYIDSQRSFVGTKNAQQTWDTKSGHCIEINTLLYAILDAYGRRPGLILTKNPIGYNCGLEKNDVGYHLFVTANKRRRTYRLDMVTRRMEESDGEVFALCATPLSTTEFVACHLIDSASDYFYHDVEKDHRFNLHALHLLSTAKSIDPNNYTADVWSSIIHRSMDDHRQADAHFATAVKKVPTLMDPWVFAGYDMLNRDMRLQMYKQALKRKTDDYQTVHVLHREFRMMGKNALARDAEAKLEHLRDSKKIRLYFKNLW